MCPPDTQCQRAAFEPQSRTWCFPRLALEPHPPCESPWATPPPESFKASLTADTWERPPPSPGPKLAQPKATPPLKSLQLRSATQHLGPHSHGGGTPAPVSAPGPTHTRQVHPSGRPCTPAEYPRPRVDGCPAARPTCSAALPSGSRSLEHGAATAARGSARARPGLQRPKPQRAAGPFARPGRGEAAVTAPPVNQRRLARFASTCARVTSDAMATE